MKTIKKAMVALLMVVALILMVAEADTFELTLYLKLGAIVSIILSTYLYQWFGLDKDKSINKYLE